jgi:uncharacterized protein
MPELPVSVDRREWIALAFALIFPTAITVVYFILLSGSSTAWQQGAFALGKVAQFAFPLVWVYWRERRMPSWSRPARGDLVAGTVLGGTILAAMLLLYFTWLKRGGMPAAAVEAIRAKIEGIGVGNPLRFALLGVFYSLFHSLLEEYYWRWFVFGRLRRLVSVRWGVVISAIGFMAHHVCVLAQFFGWTSLLTAFFSLSVAVGGILWALLHERHGSLYGVWLSHLLVDAGIFAIGYDLALAGGS